MGVHDFISFIQQNGQDLWPFVPTGESSETALDEEGDETTESDGNVSEAVLVRIPKEIDPTGILGWNLARFRDYPQVSTTYSYDHWRFEFQDPEDDRARTEYGDSLDTDLGGKGIWESISYPGEWMVTFTKAEYDAFVMGNASPNSIPRRYYAQVFENRGIPLPPTKTEAFCVLVAGPR